MTHTPDYLIPVSERVKKPQCKATVTWRDQTLWCKKEDGHDGEHYTEAMDCWYIPYHWRDVSEAPR